MTLFSLHYPPFSYLLLLFICIHQCGVLGQNITFLNTESSITCASISLRWQGGVPNNELPSRTSGLPDVRSNLGNTQSHIFTPDFPQVLAGDQFTFIIQDNAGNSASKQFASSTEGCPGSGSSNSGSETASQIDITKQITSFTSATVHSPNTQNLVPSSNSSSSSLPTTTSSSSSLSLSSGGPTKTKSSPTSSESTSVPTGAIGSTSASNPSNSASVPPTTNTSPPTDTTLSTSSSTHTPFGAIVGGVLGGLVFLALLILAILFIIYKVRPAGRSLNRYRRFDTESSGRRTSGMMIPVPFNASSPEPSTEKICSPSLLPGRFSARGASSPPTPSNDSNPSNDPNPNTLNNSEQTEGVVTGFSEGNTVSTMTFPDSGGDMQDIAAMQRRIALLLAENAHLAGLPPPSYPGSLSGNEL
ncbi:hypothetical protein GYMLUDRAFT_35297 [Collybiopsis luxurians FD-317 M1]|nr:hypothetical protein GYMLUDRAFT_35297 [Collybiopsis luxurians FD-317 M1]